MAQILKFYDERHEYTLNGEKIPSVSEIARFASREIYGDISQYMLDNAADRGKKVHSAAEILDREKTVKVDDDIVPYIKAYMNFLKEYAPEYIAIEKAYASQTEKYAGTLDRVARIHGKDGISIIDIKSSSVVQKVLARIQLNGYKKLFEENTGESVSHIFILHLKKDETFRLIEFEKDNTLFDACLALHKALEKKKRGKNIG